MAYTTRDKEGVSILDIEGEIDLYQSPALRSELGKLIAKQDKAVAINFQKVTYIDSSGLATVIDAFQKTRVYGGRLVLFAMAKPVRNVFEVARLDQFFSIFDEETAAVSFLRSSAAPTA